MGGKQDRQMIFIHVHWHIQSLGCGCMSLKESNYYYYYYYCTFSMLRHLIEAARAVGCRGPYLMVDRMIGVGN